MSVTSGWQIHKYTIILLSTKRDKGGALLIRNVLNDSLAKECWTLKASVVWHPLASMNHIHNTTLRITIREGLKRSVACVGR